MDRIQETLGERLQGRRMEGVNEGGLLLQTWQAGVGRLHRLLVPCRRRPGRNREPGHYERVLHDLWTSGHMYRIFLDIELRKCILLRSDGQVPDLRGRSSSSDPVYSESE